MANIEDVLNDVYTTAEKNLENDPGKLDQIGSLYDAGLEAVDKEDTLQVKKIIKQIQQMSGGSDRGVGKFEPKPVTSKSNVSGGDVEHERQVLIDKLQHGLKGALMNLSGKRRDLQNVLDPQEFEKFENEFQVYQSMIPSLTHIIKRGDEKVLRKYGNTIVDTVKQASYGLNGRAKRVIDEQLPKWPTQEEHQAEKAQKNKERFEKTLSAPNVQVADDIFSQHGLDPNNPEDVEKAASAMLGDYGDEIGDPDAAYADDEEGNEVIPDDPRSLGIYENDFASKIRKLMRESYNRSYKEATKKLL